LSRTANLKRQHDFAVAIVGQIEAGIAAWSGPGDAYPLALLIARLTGILRIHFVQEDVTLYPYMLESSDERAAATARAYQAEMGDLGGRYEEFAARWGASAAIAEDFEGFRHESQGLFAALKRRIDRENETLYPLADSIDAAKLRRPA
jgi:hemerythrin-like domain-containing protein